MVNDVVFFKKKKKLSGKDRTSKRISKVAPVVSMLLLSWTVGEKTDISE